MATFYCKKIITIWCIVKLVSFVQLTSAAGIFDRSPPAATYGFFPGIIKMWGQNGYRIFNTFQDPDLLTVNSSHWIPTLPTVLFIPGFNYDVRRVNSNTLTLFSALMNGTTRANYLFFDWNQTPANSIFPPDQRDTVEYPMLRYPESNYYLLTQWAPRYAIFAAKSLLFLRDKGYVRGSDLYIFGHSIGAHMAGQVASLFRDLTGDSVQIISALDPAGVIDPLPPGGGAQLSRNDANYVEVYYSNLDFYGMRSNHLLDVHLSWIVNNGKEHKQCQQNAYWDGTNSWVHFCNHLYAIVAFLEASALPLSDSTLRGCDCVVGIEFDSPEYHACMRDCPNPVLAGVHNTGGVPVNIFAMVSNHCEAMQEPKIHRGNGLNSTICYSVSSTILVFGGVLLLSLNCNCSLSCNDTIQYVIR